MYDRRIKKPSTVVFKGVWTLLTGTGTQNENVQWAMRIKEKEPKE